MNLHTLIHKLSPHRFHIEFQTSQCYYMRCRGCGARDYMMKQARYTTGTPSPSVDETSSVESGGFPQKDE